MSYQSDLAKVKGLGTAKHGFKHWWMQRMSAVLLISLLRMDAVTAANMLDWMAHPLNAIGLLLFTLTASYHGALGLQVVVEDYVGSHSWQLILQYLIKLSMILLMMINIYAVSTVLFG
jgi:succinate dehydrogenase / fumarate reductase membrane anchor subunit